MPPTINTFTASPQLDLTLGSTIDVTASLTLSTGKLVIGNNTITASSVLGYTSSRYVVTDGTGYLKIRNIGAGANRFPVGPTVSSYNPVVINNSGTADNFAVNVKTTFDFAVPDPTKVVNRQWMINEDVAGGTNATLSLTWTTADQAAGFNPASSVVIMRHNGVVWEATAATVTGSGTVADPYVATASGFTAFSPFAVANMAIVPSTLLSFNAGFKNNVVQVLWKTTNEFNAASYEVERSIDGRNFAKIGSLPARNASTESIYNFDDVNPYNGVSYYRLRSVDKNAAFTYSQVVVVNSKTKGLVTVYPNPAVDQVLIMHDAVMANASLDLMTLDGKLLKSQVLTLGSTQSTLNVSDLNAGVYLLIIKNGQERNSIKLIRE